MINGSGKILHRIDMAELSTSNFAETIKRWIHFDNLAATFTRQAQQARTARFKWETEAIEYLKESKMLNAIIQIAGGRLTVVEEKHAQALTLQRLESLLHDYFNTKPAGSSDETLAIMAYIKANRGSVTETRLKKS